MKNDYITVIGGGLAGTEAAYQIAKRGIKVKLYEMKPVKFSPAHNNTNLAEIVCSNSFKSNLLTNACGLLKEELRRLDSLLIKIADDNAVPAGQALAVDREKFAEQVTKEIERNENIEIIHIECGVDEYSIEKMAKDGIVIIATGPLTSNALSQEIAKITGNDDLHFYDAAAPIVEKESINMNIAFWGDRYSQERAKDEEISDWKERISKIGEADYINLPMNKEEYENFVNELINAEVVELHDFEKKEIFEGCMPIEIMAKRGIDTLRFGPLKPVGFTDPRTGFRPYAVVQLRRDNKEGNLYNIVGFQTNLKFGEQSRVFKMIPGLQDASFVKYGVMHRNTYINSPKLLDETYNLVSSKNVIINNESKLQENQKIANDLHESELQENKKIANDLHVSELPAKNEKSTTCSNIFFAGQITGVEGYVESISSGLVAALNAVNMYKNLEKTVFDSTTIIGALAKYISTENKNFQPMNANFGILPGLDENIRDKKERYAKLAERSLKKLDFHIKNTFSRDES